MVNKGELMDKEAPLPFVRPLPDFQPNTIKFVFEREKMAAETTQKKDVNGDVVETVTVTKTYMGTVKVNLRVYSQSAEEDRERYFEAFEILKKRIEPEYNEAMKSKTNDAKVLFEAFDEMLDGTANTNWHDVLQQEPKRDWGTFKIKVSEFVCTKVLPKDAYNTQVNYLMERSKPMKLTVEQWWARYQTLNNRLPYMIPTMDRLKAEVPNADFKAWWIEGALNDAVCKRAVLNKIPSSWNKLLKKVDIGSVQRETQTTQGLVNWFAISAEPEDRGEQDKKQKARTRQSKDNDRKRQTIGSNRSSHGNDYHRTGRQSDNSNRYNRYRNYQRRYDRYTEQNNRSRESEYRSRESERSERSNDREHRYNTRSKTKSSRREEVHLATEHSGSETEDEIHLIARWNDILNVSSDDDSSYGSRGSDANYYSGGTTETDDEDHRGKS